MYFMKFFLFILCPFISHLHAPLMQNHTKILLYLKSVCLILTHVHFRSHSNSTLHRLVTIFKAQFCEIQYFFSTSQFSWKQVYDHTHRRRRKRWLKAFSPFYNVFFHIKDCYNHFSRYIFYDLLSSNVFNMDRSGFFPQFAKWLHKSWLE